MNSLDIYLDPVKSPGVMSAKIWIREGSRADPVRQKGAHQLLGSLLSRGCGPHSHDDVGDLVEGCGAGLHCETYEDGFLISLKCIERDAYTLLPLIGWMIKEPHLKRDQINIEKALSIQSLRRQKENPFYLAYDAWRRLAYGEGPYGHDPLGCIEDLQKIGRSELSLLSKALITRKKILVISGALPADLIKSLKTMEPFSFLKQTSPTSPFENSRNSIQKKINKACKLTLQPIETSQIVMMLGLPTISHKHKDDLLLHLLSCHLGSGMSSKLFIELREKNGVAYDVGVHHPTKEYNSPFIIHASTTQEKSKYTLQLLKQCWRNIIDSQLSKESLALAKAKYQSQIAHASQTVGQRAERKAHLLGLNLPLNHDQENLKRIESITSEDLQIAAEKHLKKPLLSLCGPQQAINDIAQEWSI